MRKTILVIIFMGLLASVFFFFRFGLIDRFRERPNSFNDETLTELEDRVAAGYYGNLHSYLIWHDGEMVMEWYAAGYGPDVTHPVYSVTKSVTSIGLGMAAEQSGTELDMQATLPELFPDYAAVLNEGDPRHATITLEDLLTMRAGYRWDEISAPFGSPGNSLTQFGRSSDWLETMFTQEITDDPGTQYTYNSGVTNVIGAYAGSLVEPPFDQFIAQELFAPLGITNFRFDTGPKNIAAAGWGLHLTPPDMVLIGRLMLNNGVWEGEQLVPADWVATSTAVHVPQAAWGQDYGYQWWRFPDGSDTVQALTQNDVFFATGYSGQRIFVVPHLDLVVVVTAADGNDGGQADASLRDYVFPAASGR